MSKWNTASDWDNSTSESGVVHESVSNTDHIDAGTVKRGYSVANPLFASNLHAYWPLHEDSGSTAYDFSGNGYDGTISGDVSLGANGPLAQTVYDFGGTDGHVDGIPSLNPPFTISAWVNADDVLNKQSFIGNGFSHLSGGWLIRLNNGDMEVFYSGSVVAGVAATTNSFQFWAVTVNSSGDTEIYKGGSSVATGSGGSSTATSSFVLGAERPDGNNPLDGQMGEVRVYDNLLTESEIQTLYDVVATDGTLTTNWKAP